MQQHVGYRGKADSDAASTRQIYRFTASYLPPIVRHATTTGKTRLRGRHCLPCLDQEQSAGGSVSMPEPDRIIRLKTVLSRTGLSRSTIYRKITEGTFPAQIRISVNGAGWRESDINRWIADPVSWRPKSEVDEFC
jgi:prophage regulatory protein